ncbi:hypothetical protein I4U23_017771 [Adineta vaga]|nr:hypothetical protein I4U23_017771 [Adineta vaga]
MSATVASVTKVLKKSKIHLIDGNSDVINECLRRHLRKLEKAGKRKTKTGRAMVTAGPTKLAFVIYFENGVIEPKVSNIRRTPPGSPSIPSPLPPPPPETASPLPPSPPALTIDAPSSSAVVPSSPLNGAQSFLPPTTGVMQWSPPNVAAPLQSFPSVADALDLVPSSLPAVDAPAPGQLICSISHERKPAWLIELHKKHSAALFPVDIESERLNGDYETTQDKLDAATEMIKLNNEEKKQLDEDKKVVDIKLMVLDEESREDETAKENYKFQSMQIRKKIGQMQALRTETDKDWLDLIDDYLRQHGMDCYRRRVLPNKAAVKRLNTGGNH